MEYKLTLGDRMAMPDVPSLYESNPIAATVALAKEIVLGRADSISLDDLKKVVLVRKFSCRGSHTMNSISRTAS